MNSVNLSAQFFANSLVTSNARTPLQLFKFSLQANYVQQPGMRVFAPIIAQLHPNRTEESILNQQSTTKIVSEVETYKYNKRFFRFTHWWLPDLVLPKHKLFDEILTRTIPRNEAGPTSSSSDKRPFSTTRTEVREFNSIFADYIRINREVRPIATLSFIGLYLRALLSQDLFIEDEDGNQPRWNTLSADYIQINRFVKDHGILYKYLWMVFNPVLMFRGMAALCESQDETGYTEEISTGSLSVNLADDVCAQLQDNSVNLLGESLIRATRINSSHNHGHDHEHCFRHRSIMLQNTIGRLGFNVYSNAADTLAHSSGVLAFARKTSTR